MLVLLVIILRVGELYTQLARYQRYWDMVNKKPIGDNDLVYVAFGDSAAQGVGASRPDKGYVGLLVRQMAGEQDSPVHVINLSKSGAKVSDVLQSQLPAYESLNISNPQVITIDIGANDILSFAPDRFRAQMDELLGKLPQNTIMADIPSFKGSRLGGHEDTVVKANGIMRELAPKYGIRLVDLYERVAENHGLRTFGGDFFHPSDYGYKSNWEKVFSQAVSDRVNSL